MASTIESCRLQTTLFVNHKKACSETLFSWVKYKNWELILTCYAQSSNKTQKKSRPSVICISRACQRYGKSTWRFGKGDVNCSRLCAGILFALYTAAIPAYILLELSSTLPKSKRIWKAQSINKILSMVVSIWYMYGLWKRTLIS